MITVAVLAGGCSPEHDVSLRSAMQVLKHLDRTRFVPWPVHLDQQGLWWVARQPLAPGQLPDAACRSEGMRALRPGAAVEFLLEHAAVQIVFPVLHGESGEDGTVQGMLELHGVPFVGSGCAASAVAMDKIRTRECFAFRGIPMARCHLPERPLATADAKAEAIAIGRTVGFPCFLKVALSGSSIGVMRCTTQADVVAFVEQQRHRRGRFIAEAQAVGEEITVPILGNSGGELEALPPVGIYPRRGDFFTHEAKYADGGSDEIVPPRGLTPAQILDVQQLGRRCHEALDCDGLSRTDMIMTAQGPIVLETNTIPGLTEASLLPKAARAHGLTFPALLTRLLEYGLQRWQGRREAS